jgi:hypothetical protein
MSGAEFLKQVYGKVGRLLSARRNDAEFSCGDCRVSERCGLPPSEKCVARAAQISDGRERPRRINFPQFPQ